MKVGVVGCAGRMGRMVIAQVQASPGCQVTAASERPGAAVLGQDAGALAGLEPIGVPVGEDTGAVFAGAEVVIDFTSPAATAHHAMLARRHRTALVVGTTGLGGPHYHALQEAAVEVPIVQAANMSLGVNLLLGLVEQVARALDDDFDIEILEMHHRHKVDAPSGTALALGRAAAAGRQRALDDVSQRVRDGQTGPRRRGDIGFAVLRGGDVVGDHSVIFAADGERVELNHRASNRAVFAAGAVKAALWLTADGGRPPGLYGMQDVLMRLVGGGHLS